MRIPSFLANTAWVGAQLTRYLRFRTALRDVQGEQELLLANYLRTNEQTEFGRRFRFDRIRTAEEYQQRVPLSVYEDYESSIGHIASGTRNVLTAAPVRCLEPSSGSTRAAKLIPYT